MIGAALASIPQVFVHNIWQLLAAQFLLGVFIGGLAPSVNALIRKYSPRGMESRSYSFNSSSLSLGNMLGPIVGGVLSGFIPFRQLFLLTALLLFINSIWVYKALIVKKKLSVEPFR
jgi:MFS family permease